MKRVTRALTLAVVAVVLMGCATSGNGYYREMKKVVIWPGGEVVVEVSGYGQPTPPQQRVEPIRWTTPGVSGTWGRGFITNCPTGTVHGPQMPTKENGGQIWKHQSVGGCSPPAKK